MPAVVVQGLHTGVVRRLPAAVDWDRMLHKQQCLIVAAQPLHLPLHAAVRHILPMQLQHMFIMESRPICVQHHTPQISILQNTAGSYVLHM